MGKKDLRRNIEQMPTYKFGTYNEHHDKLSKITSYVEKSEVLEIINQLDEPETLSQEWIDMRKCYDEEYHAEFVYADELQNLLMPKQEEVDQAYKAGYEKGKEHTTEKERETVGSVFMDFLIASAKLKLALSMEVEELEE